ncbi:MAG: S-layer homology domain-containing protein [Peptococcia bacterium]|jgi:uncharacterized repeat protein (TIGR02543 family)
MQKKGLQGIFVAAVLTFIFNLCIYIVPVLGAEMLSLSDPLSGVESVSLTENSFHDIAGHWAENGIKAWTSRGLAGGYPDGTFRPDSPITRAEFLALVNRVFGYTEVVAGKVNSSATLVAFRDVAETDWYAAEVAKAAAVGYLGGYADGTMKPLNPITRQEVAAVLAKILPPAAVSENNIGFTDKAQIPEWSQAAIAAAVNGCYMNGYPDGTFQASKAITRAEAIAVLERAAGTIYNRAGTYGPFQGTVVLEGNVTVNTPGVTLQNTTISGNLYLTEGIGEGDVTLKNVTVQGTTKISGGGSDSIHLLNTAMGEVVMVNGKTINENSQFFEPKKKKSKDVTLSDLTINGTTIAGFAVDTLSYEVALPYGTTEVEIPIVAATAHHSKATVEVTQATGLTAPDNVATVLVTAENGRTQTYTVSFTVALDSAKAITGFSFTLTELGPEAQVVEGIINETAKTITVTVPFGTDITSLTPTITHSGANISPAAETPQNFTDSVTYTVTAEDGTSAEYEVTVYVALSSEVSLSKFEIGGENVLGLGGINAPEGATLAVSNFIGFLGIEVEATNSDATVTVALNDEELEGDLTTQAIAANDVIAVTVVAADGETEGQYKVTVVQGYTVTYHENSCTGGSAPTDESVYQEEATVTVMGNTGTLVKEGYSFAGWNTAADGSGIFYEAGETFTMGTADVTLYAQWAIADFAVDENDVFGTTATFTWSAALGATSIAIQQSTDGGSNWENATTFEALSSGANSAVVTGLTKDTSYQFKLVVTGGITAGESNTIDVTTEAVAMYGASWDSSTDATSMARLGDAIGAIGKTTAAEIGPFFDQCAPWSGMKLCNVADDGTINAFIGDPGFARDGSYGQVMVQIPKFYYKHTYDEITKKHQFWVAEWASQAEAALEDAGFKLHPAFIRAGEEKEYILMGAYKAGEINDGNIKLTSVSGALPAVYRSRATFRSQAKNRGDNWCIVDALARNAVALLYLVEYADTNSQSAIGEGITGLRYNNEDEITVASTEPGYTIIVSNATADCFKVGEIIGVSTRVWETNICYNRTIESILEYDGANKIITVKDEDGAPFSTTVGNIIHHVGQKTGGCDSLYGASGSADITMGDTVSVSYRGLEDLWGNLEELIDGMNIKGKVSESEWERQPYIADSNFTDTITDDYVGSGVILPTDEGYLKNFAYSANADWLLMPSEAGLDGSWEPDFFYRNWNEDPIKVVLTGGSWNVENRAGMFSFNTHSNATVAFITVGTRLLQIP